MISQLSSCAFNMSNHFSIGKCSPDSLNFPSPPHIRVTMERYLPFTSISSNSSSLTAAYRKSLRQIYAVSGKICARSCMERNGSADVIISFIAWVCQAQSPRDSDSPRMISFLLTFPAAGHPQDSFFLRKYRMEYASGRICPVSLHSSILSKINHTAPS